MGHDVAKGPAADTVATASGTASLPAKACKTTSCRTKYRHLGRLRPAAASDSDEDVPRNSQIRPTHPVVRLASSKRRHGDRRGESKSRRLRQWIVWRGDPAATLSFGPGPPPRVVRGRIFELPAEAPGLAPKPPDFGRPLGRRTCREIDAAAPAFSIRHRPAFEIRNAACPSGPAKDAAMLFIPTGPDADASRPGAAHPGRQAFAPSGAGRAPTVDLIDRFGICMEPSEKRVP